MSKETTEKEPKNLEVSNTRPRRIAHRLSRANERINNAGEKVTPYILPLSVIGTLLATAGITVAAGVSEVKEQIDKAAKRQEQVAQDEQMIQQLVNLKGAELSPNAPLQIPVITLDQEQQSFIEGHEISEIGADPFFLPLPKDLTQQQHVKVDMVIVPKYGGGTKAVPQSYSYFTPELNYEFATVDSESSSPPVFHIASTEDLGATTATLREQELANGTSSYVLNIDSPITNASENATLVISIDE